MSAPPFRLSLFGEPLLERDASAVALSAQQSHLLALVGCAGPDGLPRREILTLLWEGCVPARERHRLAQLLYSLRKRLGTEVLSIGHKRIGIDPARVVCPPWTAPGPDAPLPWISTDRITSGFLPGLEDPVPRALRRWLDEQESVIRSRVRRSVLDWLTMASRSADPRDLEAMLELWLSVSHDPETDSSVAGDLLLSLPAAWRDRILFRLRRMRSPDDQRSEQPHARVAERMAIPHIESQIPLVGREDALDRIVGSLLGGGVLYPSVLVIEGEGGMGKTRILHEALDLVERQGLRTLRLQGGEFLGSTHLAPFSEYAGYGKPRRRERRGFPGIRRILADLRDRSEQVPLIVAVDDAQWLDRRSIAVLDQLLLEPAPRFRIVLTHTPELRPSKGAFPGFLASLRSVHRAESVVLDPLDLAQAHRLLARGGLLPSGAEEQEELCRKGGGNPLFLIEWARFHRDPAERPAPPRVARFVEQRRSLVGRTAQTALTLVAGAPEGVSHEDLRCALRISPLRLTSVIRELGDRRLIAPAPDRIRVAHPGAARILSGARGADGPSSRTDPGRSDPDTRTEVGSPVLMRLWEERRFAELSQALRRVLPEDARTGVGTTRALVLQGLLRDRMARELGQGRCAPLLRSLGFWLERAKEIEDPDLVAGIGCERSILAAEGGFLRFFRRLGNARFPGPPVGDAGRGGASPASEAALLARVEWEYLLLEWTPMGGHPGGRAKWPVPAEVQNLVDASRDRTVRARILGRWARIAMAVDAHSHARLLLDEAGDLLSGPVLSASLRSVWLDRAILGRHREPLSVVEGWLDRVLAPEDAGRRMDRSAAALGLRAILRFDLGAARGAWEALRQVKGLLPWAQLTPTDLRILDHALSLWSGRGGGAEAFHLRALVRRRMPGVWEGASLPRGELDVARRRE